MNQSKLELPPEVSAEEATELLAIKLYERGKLMLAQAARLAGYSRRAFMEVLGKQGVPVIDYPADELAQELES